MTSVRFHVALLTGWVLLLGACAPGRGGSVAELRAENERLRGRVAALEARLTGAGLTVDSTDGVPPDGAAGGWVGEANGPGEPGEDVAALRERNRRLERLAGLTPMDDAVAAEAARIVTERDGATGVETVTSRPVPINFEGFNLATPHAVAFGYGAREAEGPGPVRLVVTTFRGRGRPYRRVQTAELTLDGRDRFTLPVTGYETLVTYPPPPNSRSGSTRYDDALTVKIEGPAAARLAHADTATLRIDGTTLPLSREHLAMFRAVAERRAMQSAAATPGAVIPGAGAAQE